MPPEPTIWHLDELAHAGGEDLDPDYVAGFDAVDPSKGMVAATAALSNFASISRWSDT